MKKKYSLIAIVFMLCAFCSIAQAPHEKETLIVIPSPLTVGIDDMGWKQGWSTDVDSLKPHHIDAPEGRWMGMADYKVVVEIAKNVNSRLLGLFIMSEFDRSNICSEFPTTTEEGENWDNSHRMSDDDHRIMNYIKDNAAYLEFGLHGVRHNHWKDGKKHGEFARHNFNKNPHPVDEMQQHLECYKRLIDQYDITFPKTFVPPRHCYYHNPEDTMDTGGLMASWGIKYVSWGHKYWLYYEQYVVNPMSELQFDNGVLVIERDQTIPWKKSVGISMDSIATDFYYETTHWHNFIAATPDENHLIAQKWIHWFNLVKDSHDRYLPKNTAQLYSQALYLKYAKIDITGNRIVIDNSQLPDWAYDRELVGNLVIKILLPKDEHISSVSIDTDAQITSFYEEGDYGYVILPELKQKKYEIEIKTGSGILSNCVINNGTYNIKQLELNHDKVLLEVEMYGTQNLHIRLEGTKPQEVKSCTEDLLVNSWEWDDQEKICEINITANDVQGVQGEIVLDVTR